MNDRLNKAYKFVKERHKNQKRKFINVSYVTHLEDTVNILGAANESIETDDLIAALLHDVVEDTKTTFEEVDKIFGREVRIIVEELTSDKKLQNSMGKEVYMTEKINKMSERAFTIKLCDRLSNVMGLNDEKTPLEFVKRYTKETNYIIKHIDRSINSIQLQLLKRLKAILLYLELQKN